MRKLSNFITVAVFLLGICVRCTTDTSLSGGTSIPNQIAGVTTHPDGTPASHAKVNLISVSESERRLPYVKDSSTTDTNGYFMFRGMGTGSYRIETVVADSNSAVLSVPIKVAESRSEKFEVKGTLGKAATAQGTVLNGSADLTLFVQISQTHYRLDVDPTGRFDFNLLPSGSYTFLYCVKNSLTQQQAIFAIVKQSLTPQANQLFDTVRFPVPLDSLMLDDFENGKNDNKWDKWWTFDDRENNGTSTVVPFDSGSLVSSPGAAGTDSCAHLSFKLGAGSPRYVGIMTLVGSSYHGMSFIRDFSKLRGMRFYMKGTGATVHGFFSPGLRTNTNLVFLKSQPLPQAWTEHVIYFDQVFADSAAQWESANKAIKQITFVLSGPSGATGDFYFDQVEFF